MYFSDSLQHESLQHFKRRSPRDFENLIRYSVDRSDNRHRRRQGHPSRGDAAAVRSGGCRILRLGTIEEEKRRRVVRLSTYCYGAKTRQSFSMRGPTPEHTSHRYHPQNSRHWQMGDRWTYPTRQKLGLTFSTSSSPRDR
ncbi:hypothetical protein CTAM01_07958 [Colletotrichum tamarilloi]|uniref:Uncharacterized protein n=1 Tax=Colletotrichum tamarilloi TaxID=1209934 RepID=A0ABQ9R7M7_9PEZI|nr:uncharacterized protein CTAM01_07958 [Colletotrichum tamarilloi]KAK1497294.1 hypothetical protein CTAM01_07958 [Colletotrichum tamarilloi]